MTNKHTKQQGLTLIELIVAMAIVMILTLVGAPSYQSFIESGRFSNATNDLYNAYRFARNEALKSASAITLKANNGQWQQGWKVFDGADLLLDVQKPHGDIQVTSSVSLLTVKGMGSLSGAQPTHFTVSGAGKTKYICILSSGQSIKQDTSC